MKAAPFAYIRPQSLEEACQVLANEEGARIIAGGQTLVPMLAMRLARPRVLVDIYRLDELRGIAVTDDGIVVKAATRQIEALHDEDIRREVPLLAKALPFVGHGPTRNRGTVGGSIANADPSAEIPLVAVTLGAEIVLADEGDEMPIAAAEFFVGPMLTVASSTACLTRVTFPRRSPGLLGVGFQEVSSRRSDFAFACAAAQVVVDEDGVCTDCRLGIGGISDFPVCVDAAELCGSALDESLVRDIVEAATADLEVTSDLHASAAYRRRAASALARRALKEAYDDARSGSAHVG